MGMLMHHTWLKEQQKQVKKPETVVRVEEPVKEKEPETEPVKRPGRRKTSK